jgi:hypothetical protein
MRNGRLVQPGAGIFAPGWKRIAAALDYGPISMWTYQEAVIGAKPGAFHGHDYSQLARRPRRA